MKFYVCEHCGRMMAEVKGGATVSCCGEPMKELIPNTVEASVEKHYIEWVALVTKHGNQRVVLNPGEEPKATFAICDGDEVLGAYAYCNLHGLWKTEL